jgi:RND family efflux transporter MFP subunit
VTEERHSGLALHAPGAEADELLKRRQVLRRFKVAALVVLLLLAAGSARTVLTRIADARTLEAAAADNAKQVVRVAQPRRSGAGQALSLPGTLQGHVQAPIAARASGYLKRWTRDIGSKVAKGELLAEIETPEIDQQLSAAIAARAQAAASLSLTRSTAERWEGLRKKDVVSQQDLDERRSALAQSQANLAAADANVERLRQLEGFKRVTAPFAGVITRRNVDVGDLIDAGGARPLFVLSQTDPLRVTLNVPQSAAQWVRPGQDVSVTQAELRGQTFRGRVERAAGAIDAATRTMQVDVTLPNRDGRLLPGAYVQVSMPLEGSGLLVVPTNTLLFRAEGTLVAVVDAQGRVALRKVDIGRNYGETTELVSGAAESDRLVMNPPDWIADGQTVVVGPDPRAASAAAKGTPRKDPS